MPERRRVLDAARIAASAAVIVRELRSHAELVLPAVFETGELSAADSAPLRVVLGRRELRCASKSVPAETHPRLPT